MIKEYVPYPIRFSIAYPEKPLQRITVLMRWIVLVAVTLSSPILISSSRAVFFSTLLSLGVLWGVFTIGPLLAILIQGKYPRRLLDWNLAVLRFFNRFVGFFFFLRNEFPWDDKAQAYHMEIPYPGADGDLNRWMALVKWIIAIPHLIALFFILIWVMVLVIIGGIGTIFGGRFPRDWFDYIVGYLRWLNRVLIYSVFLATDQHPPYRLSQ